MELPEIKWRLNRRNWQIFLLIVSVLAISSCGLISAGLTPSIKYFNQISQLELSDRNPAAECPRWSMEFGLEEDNCPYLQIEARGSNSSSFTCSSSDSKLTTAKSTVDYSWMLKSRIFIPFVLFVILCLASYGQMTLTRKAKMVNRFPHPTKYPLFGNGFQSIGKSSEQLALHITKFRETYGRCSSFWASHYPCIVIMEAESAQKLLSSARYIEKGRLYKSFKWLMGNGLITSNGEKWREDRKLLNPSFKYQRFDGFLASFNKHSKILVEILGKTFSKGCEVKDLHPILMRCTIDFVSESALGECKNVQNDPEANFAEMTKLALNSFRTKIVKPWLAVPIIWNIFGLAKDERKVLKFMKEIFSQFVKDRKEIRLNPNKDATSLGTSPFMDALLDTHSERDIRAHVVTIFGAGFETTASGMNYTLYLLALNPEHQKKVHEELDTIFGADRNRDVTFNDLAELKYLEMCLKEAMRLFPPAPVILRVPDEDIPLDNGLVIPKGCDVAFLIREIQTDPKHFPDPEKFDPNRFLPEMCTNRNPYAFMPFSVGPRNCLGQKYAMLQMKSAMAHILRNFEVTTSKKREDLRLVYGMVLEPSGGLPLTLKKRSTALP